jgi:hypothetical protein
VRFFAVEALGGMGGEKAIAHIEKVSAYSLQERTGQDFGMKLTLEPVNQPDHLSCKLTLDFCLLSYSTDRHHFAAAVGGKAAG